MEYIVQCNPQAEVLEMREELDLAWKDCLDAGRYILGSATAAFEKEFATYCQCTAAIGTASGTDALVLILRGLGVGLHARVATVSHTAVATVAAIELAGADPVLVDVNLETFVMCLGSLEATLQEDHEHRIRAIIAVHLYGHPAPVREIAMLAKRHGAYLIEDASQAHGACIGNSRVGSLAEAAAFSLYPTKNLGALGDAGVVTTSNPSLAEHLREIREYGWRRRYIAERPGMNTRLDELQAAILRPKLKRLDRGNVRRREIAARYNAVLANSAKLMGPISAPQMQHVFHQFVVRVEGRENLRAYLEAQGVGSAIHYPVPVHQQPAYCGRLSLSPGGLPCTESLSGKILSLPMYPQMTDVQVEHVCGVLERFDAL